MKTQLYLLAMLSALPLNAAKQTEHTITNETVKHALSDLNAPLDKHENATNHVSMVDLKQVNSSTEKPSISFSSLEQSITTIEKELVELREKLADIKTAAVEHARADHAKNAQLKEENEALTIELAHARAEIEAGQGGTGVEVDGDEEDEDFLESDEEGTQTQDVVAIIANEGDEEEV